MRSKQIILIFEQICCYDIAFMASFTSITMVKFEVVNFVDDRTINQFIEMGYFLVNGAVHWYLTYFMMFRFNKISNTFESWNDHEKKINGGENITSSKKKPEWLPKINWMITLTMTIIKSIVYTDWEKWSLEGLILDNSIFVSYGIFIWVPDHLYDETLSERFGTKLNATTYLMGIIGGISQFCWNLRIDCFKDTLIWVATTNKYHMLRFGRKIKKSQLEKILRKMTTNVGWHIEIKWM